MTQHIPIALQDAGYRMLLYRGLTAVPQKNLSNSLDPAVPPVN